MAEAEDKMKLFDSNDEDDDSVENDFKIRPQYQGPHGLEILEMNTQLSKRFKLDERFAEDSETETTENAGTENLSNENEEKMKNIRILESVLGHEVVKPSADKNSSRKRLVRYDPDDESASKFVKTPENTSEKPKKSKKKKAVVEEKVEETLPISTERYIEVCSNLKDILNTSTPFSFSNKFNFDSEEPVLSSKDGNDNFKISEDVEMLNVEQKKQSKQDKQPEHSKLQSFIPLSKCDAFFIKEDDPRLQEGVEFFKRPKSMEAIRVEWQERRDRVLELFRQKKRRSQRSHSTRVKTAQMKNMIRKNNLKH